MTAGAPHIRFVKYCCGGNDFLIFDCRTREMPGDAGAFVRSICHRRTGAGADGAIFLRPDEEHPFRIALFNADGSRAEVSYNGSRCVGLHAVDSGIAASPFTFGSDAGPVAVEVDGAEVRLQVPPPTEVRTAMALDIPGEAPLRASYVVAGVPYLVLVVEDLEDPWVERVPPTLKTHRAFPAGTNVAVARFDDVRGLRARFFERGVEEETPSSGTGCVAVALLSALLHDLPSPVTVTTAGGDFRISFTRAGEGFADIITGGRVDYACRGEAALSQ